MYCQDLLNFLVMYKLFFYDKRRKAALAEEARLKEIKERQTLLLEQLRQLKTVNYDFDKDISDELKKRLIYLTQQAEVYSLFMQGINKLPTAKGTSINFLKTENNATGRQRENRLTEEEEDTILRECEKQNFVRLNTQVKYDSKIAELYQRW